MNFSIAQISRVGGREINEDRVGYCYTPQAGIFVLADGMGGHPEGEVAAEIAVQTLAAEFQKASRARLSDSRAFLADAVREAHRAILRHAAGRGMRDTPRTTLVVALIEGGNVSWAHCGDSRLYWIRQGALLVRTRDHSYAERKTDELVARAMAGQNRHVLYTCLGSPVDPVIDLAGPVALQQGDRILLCSDGLWDPLEESEVVTGLADADIEPAIEKLVEQALARAGVRSDNISALALEWTLGDGFEETRQAEAAHEGDDMFASTIQMEDADTVPSDLDDASIDRSIAEINEAIRRTAAQRKK